MQGSEDDSGLLGICPEEPRHKLTHEGRNTSAPGLQEEALSTRVQGLLAFWTPERERGGPASVNPTSSDPRGWGRSAIVECSPRMLEGPGSIPSTIKRPKKEVSSALSLHTPPEPARPIAAHGEAAATAG